MKLAIVGGKDFSDKEIFKAAIKPIFHQIELIISGGAPGADSMAEKFADNASIPKSIHPALWDDFDVDEPIYYKYDKTGRAYNALAGFNRNSKIVAECEVLYAFWNGKSPGTKDSITKAQNQNKTVKIFSY